MTWALNEQADNLRRELVTAMGLDPASQSLTFNPRIHAFAQAIRAQALREAADIKPFGTFGGVGGWRDGFHAGCKAKADAILALIDAPPAAAPERPEVVALAKLFERFWEQEGGLASSEWEDWLDETGFVDWQPEGNCYVLTPLGESALALARTR